MPNQVHGVLLRTMPGFELSRVRTELERLRILTTIPPHPIQPDRQPAPHRYLGNALVSTHRQVNILMSPARMDTRCCLGRLHQQEAQQGIALFADVPQPLLASTGLLTRTGSSASNFTFGRSTIWQSKLASERMERKQMQP